MVSENIHNKLLTMNYIKKRMELFDDLNDSCLIQIYFSISNKPIDSIDLDIYLDKNLIFKQNICHNFSVFKNDFSKKVAMGEHEIVVIDNNKNLKCTSVLNIYYNSDIYIIYKNEKVILTNHDNDCFTFFLRVMD